MARFTKTIDIWALTDEERAKLPIGQWVTAGPDGPKGQFFGQGACTVVGWLGNARRGGKGGYALYMRALRDYGRSIRNAS